MSKGHDTTDSEELYTPVFQPKTSNEINKRGVKRNTFNGNNNDNTINDNINDNYNDDNDKIDNDKNDQLKEQNEKSPKITTKEKKKKKRVVFSNLSLDDVIYRVKHSKHRPNYYFWGSTGSGKTYCAYKIAASLNRKDNEQKTEKKKKRNSEECVDIILEGQKQLYKKALSQYWRNYHGEKVILMDDVTTENTKFFQQFLKTWGNMYPFEAITDLGNSDGLEQRNVTKMTIDPNKYTFIITSNKPPEEVFTFNSEEFERFNRLFYTIQLNSYFTGLFGDESYISSDEDTDSAASEKKTVTIHSKEIQNDEKSGTSKGMSLLHDEMEDIYPTMDVIDEIPTVGEVVDHHGYDATDPFINDNTISEESEEKKSSIKAKMRLTTKVGDTFKRRDCNKKKSYGLKDIPLGLKRGVDSQSDKNINDDRISNTNKVIRMNDNKPIIINDSGSKTDSEDETYRYEEKSSEEDTLESSENDENNPIIKKKSIITTDYDSKIKAKKMNPEIPKKELRKYSEPKEYLGKGVYYDAKIERERRNKRDDMKLLINSTKMNKKDVENKPKKNDEDFIIHRIKNPELINALQRIKDIKEEIQRKLMNEPMKRKTRELGPEDRIEDKEMKIFEQYTIKTRNELMEDYNNESDDDIDNIINGINTNNNTNKNDNNNNNDNNNYHNNEEEQEMSSIHELSEEKERSEIV